MTVGRSDAERPGKLGQTSPKAITNTVHYIGHARTIQMPTQFRLEYREVAGDDLSDDKQT